MKRSSYSSLQLLATHQSTSVLTFSLLGIVGSFTVKRMKRFNDMVNQRARLVV